MSHGVVVAVVGAFVVGALVVLLVNAIRGQDVSWRMSYTTRRRRRRRGAHADLSQDDSGEDEDDGS